MPAFFVIRQSRLTNDVNSLNKAQKKRLLPWNFQELFEHFLSDLCRLWVAESPAIKIYTIEISIIKNVTLFSFKTIILYSLR